MPTCTFSPARRTVAAVAVLLLIFAPALASAQISERLREPEGPGRTRIIGIPKQIVPDACRAGGSGCTLCHMGEMVINLTAYLIYAVALPLSVLLVAVGGFTLLISGASEERRTLGKKILTSTIIGVIIVLVAWLAVDTLIRVLTGTTNLTALGPWHVFEVAKCPL